MTRRRPPNPERSRSGSLPLAAHQSRECTVTSRAMRCTSTLRREASGRGEVEERRPPLSLMCVVDVLTTPSLASPTRTPRNQLPRFHSPISILGGDKVATGA
eukprot:scaffold51152_cov61-Phaeocystis_antarctica.AAC.5